jgi:hypothetical protein
MPLPYNIPVEGFAYLLDILEVPGSNIGPDIYCSDYMRGFWQSV